MKEKKPKIEKRGTPIFNPLINPTVISKGFVFIPTGAPVIFHKGKIVENPEVFLEEWPLSDYAQFIIGLKITYPLENEDFKHIIPDKNIGEEHNEEDVFRLFFHSRKSQLGISEVGSTLIRQRGI